MLRYEIIDEYFIKTDPNEILTSYIFNRILHTAFRSSLDYVSECIKLCDKSNFIGYVGEYIALKELIPRICENCTYILSKASELDQKRDPANFVVYKLERGHIKQYISDPVASSLASKLHINYEIESLLFPLVLGKEHKITFYLHENLGSLVKFFKNPETTKVNKEVIKWLVQLAVIFQIKAYLYWLGPPIFCDFICITANKKMVKRDLSLEFRVRKKRRKDNRYGQEQHENFSKEEFVKFPKELNYPFLFR